MDLFSDDTFALLHADFHEVHQFTVYVFVCYLVKIHRQHCGYLDHLIKELLDMLLVNRVFYQGIHHTPQAVPGLGVSPMRAMHKSQQSQILGGKPEVGLPREYQIVEHVLARN